MLRSIKSISNTYLILDKEKFIEYSIKNKDKYFLIHFRENEYLISPWNSKKLISEYIDDIQKVRPTKEVEKPKPVRKKSPRKKE